MSTSDLLISSIKLNDSNYQSWVIKIRAILMSKMLWGYVKGIEPKDAKDYLTKACAASGTIMLSLEDSQFTHIAGMEEDPALMWKTLEDVHIQKKPNSRHLAYATLLSITKQPEESLPALTTRIEQAMKDVIALRPQDYSLSQLDDDLSCMAMLRSLPSEYSSFVSTISLMDNISMPKLKSAFITEEANRKAIQSQSHHPVAAHLASKPSSHSFAPCGWCLRKGHTEENCFAKDNSKLKARMHRGQRGSSNSSSQVNSSQAPSPSPPSQVNSTQAASHPSPPPPPPQATPQHASHSSLSQSSPNLTFHWCADSGASSHMTPHRHWFAKYSPYVIPIELADGNIIHSAGIGSVTFIPLIKGVPGRPVEISGVLHVPALCKSLLSLTQWTLKSGFKVIMEKDSMVFFLKGSLVCTAKLHGNLACLQGSTVNQSHHSASALNTTTSPLDLTLWHRRFSHLNFHDLKSIKSHDLVTGFHLSSHATPDPICVL